jgi:cell division protease FtsH
VLPAPGSEGFASAGELLADETRKLFDGEVRRIVDDAYERATTLLHEHRPQLDALVAALLERETLDEADAYRIAGIERPQVSANGAGPAQEVLLPETDTV